ncbi:iron-hydroxamate ABC transporter substrate-binding protein [Robertmurraya yapensis]|uniref:Iron-hydroxamate ABC transporter substrate-binding protein n=2 Tax=Bacillaceae TaxID=186817 RepID=A0A3S0IDM6_9BACI|nr:iron-hydroxamate ABC transporter substrate-binding protein [Bacillus yapensis]RTR33128.1 iron-hydroxamate ABC transporter substrate-binding protein [Bacillus yapensis]TKS96951.1 iron-hydroxamate ABC transporter substrate-binding protein [Bacillus yapensis]
MKKKLLFLSILVLIGLLAACGKDSKQPVGADSETKTRVFHAENGDVEIPVEPKRVAVLAHIYVGNVLELGVKPVAVNEWVKGNKFFGDQIEDVEVVTDGAVEKLIELEPDLIITFTNDQNIKKYSEIAPVVALTNTNYDYLEQHLEIGEILGKEKEAQEWVDEWNEKAAEAKEKVRAAIGEDATAMVIEQVDKETYIYGQNWGRGTEVMYQALGIKAPEKVKADVFGPGYKAISPEVIPEYAADYIFVGVGENDADPSFTETSVWKEIPAVKNGNVFKFDSESFWFNDAITLENQLEFVVNSLTKEN